jgi:hypothetical protein
VKFLAYRHYRQRYAYWPDSRESRFDKRNVRDGHYPIWGPLHFIANAGPIQNPNAARVLGYFNGNSPLPQGVNLIDLEIAAHTVPMCAMRVQRQRELGDISVYRPSVPCGCYFEAQTDRETSCRTCTTNADCNTSTEPPYESLYLRSAGRTVLHVGGFGATLMRQPFAGFAAHQHRPDVDARSGPGRDLTYGLCRGRPGHGRGRTRSRRGICRRRRLRRLDLRIHGRRRSTLRAR